jgi:hypothetical protein
MSELPAEQQEEPTNAEAVLQFVDDLKKGGPRTVFFHPDIPMDGAEFMLKMGNGFLTPCFRRLHSGFLACNHLKCPLYQHEKPVEPVPLSSQAIQLRCKACGVKYCSETCQGKARQGDLQQHKYECEMLQDKQLFRTLVGELVTQQARRTIRVLVEIAIILGMDYRPLYLKDLKAHKLAKPGLEETLVQLQALRYPTRPHLFLARMALLGIKQEEVDKALESKEHQQTVLSGDFESSNLLATFLGLTLVFYFHRSQDMYGQLMAMSLGLALLRQERQWAAKPYVMLTIPYRDFMFEFEPDTRPSTVFEQDRVCQMHNALFIINLHSMPQDNKNDLSLVMHINKTGGQVFQVLRGGYSIEAWLNRDPQKVDTRQAAANAMDFAVLKQHLLDLEELGNFTLSSEARYAIFKRLWCFKSDTQTHFKPDAFPMFRIAFCRASLDM